MSFTGSEPPIIAIAGPTASGKSTLAIELARRLHGEIINCDSVQVYRDIHVATAKVPMEERRGVPHHLLDFVSPHVDYTAGGWAREAVLKIKEIEGRGNLPFLVGGSGFYLRALRQPFFPSPARDENLRQRLNELRLKHGSEHLHRVLAWLDPDSARELFPRDWPRIQRALEVYLQTGKRLSEQKPFRQQPPQSVHRIRVFALDPPRDLLYQRINARTEGHFAAGLVPEVQQLLAAGVPANSSALGAHGYRRVVEYLAGERSLESAIEQTKLDVRHYAKRQLTWFRREPDVEWIAGFGEDEAVIAQVLDWLAPQASTKTG